MMSASSNAAEVKAAVEAVDKKEDDDNSNDGVTTTLPPSHILQDGAFVNLAPPTNAERIRFFERSVARRGLLQEDLTEKKTATNGGGEQEEAAEESADEPKIHPLALASARLQSNGINELNRAVNLHTLVAAKDYFGLSNIVDPAHTKVPKTSAAAAAAAGGVKALEEAEALRQAEEARTKSVYILKRKRVQFEQAAATLSRHCTRLKAAIVAQKRPDVRLRELRPVWRLVAPEHGTRAASHAARPTETVAADVDVYHHNRGQMQQQQQQHNTTSSSSNSSSSSSSNALGRLASRVPRYATVELQTDYTVDADLQKWEQEHFRNDKSSSSSSSSGSIMQVDDAAKVGAAAVTPGGEEKACTRAEPFAIADPALGKIDTDFDPTKVAMLTLQFDVCKPSTGYVQSACLAPIRSAANNVKEDEQLLVALQHSLFCAKLFESIRRELAPDTEDVGQLKTSKVQSAVWLSGESEENFLPPASLMISSEHSGLVPLCVVHVHEGDVKVLLDCEYSLRVRLVESTSDSSEATSSSADAPTASNSDSGSQNPEQLLTLIRTLLLHAQETHHRHSVEANLRAQQEAEEKKLLLLQKDNPRIKALPPVQSKETAAPSPRILQSCVSLGTKMLFERRIRKTLKKVNDWIKSTSASSNAQKEGLTIEWLSLSIFDLAAQFTVSFMEWSVDANIVGDELTVTRFGHQGEYRKVKFHTDKEFELYLKTALRRALQSKV